MSIQLDPVELGFKRPFNQEVTETLRLRNPNPDPVAFKVKTTAPKQYCVRPNSGRIDPGQQVEVQVLLQAMKEDPPLEAKCKDKFLVQSVAVPANQEFTNVANIWQAVEQTAKGSVNEKKIRVNFLPASGTAPTESSTPARRSGVGEEEPPAYSSPASHAATPAQNAATSKDTQSKENGGIGGLANSAGGYAGAAAGAVAGAAGAAAASVPTSTEEAKQQLEGARTKISSAAQQAQDSAGLRQRKAPSGATDKNASAAPGLGMQQSIPGGVPVPLVAALCLLSFLLAYMLF